MKISEKARTLLAEEYERHGKYPTYAQQAMTSDAEFTMCSLRAIERALGDAPQPPVGGDVEVRRVSVEMLKGGSWRYKAEPDGALVMVEDHRAHVTALQARVAELEEDLEREVNSGREIAKIAEKFMASWKSSDEQVAALKAQIAHQVTK